MKRRNFILSSLFVTTQALLSSVEPFFKFGISLAGNLPIPSEESLVPEKAKGKGIKEFFKNDTVTLKNNSYNSITLNEVGTVIWNHIDGNNSCQHIADYLCAIYSIERKRAVNDTEFFVNKLKNEGFLVLSKKSPCYRLG